MSNCPPQRDDSIDMLRWIALTGIILVHIQPSAFWSQLRSFDVPMMVFLSAYCFAGNPHGIKGYKSYCIKRFVRLVFPCWIFLSCWFPFYYGVLGHPVDLTNMGMCYTLLTPWYFWIIRIFLLMAFIAPLISKPLSTLSPKQFYFVMVMGLVANEIFCYLSESYFYVVVVMTFSYLLVFIYGFSAKRLADKHILTIGWISAFVFVIIAYLLHREYGEFILVGQYKYPPHLYYLSYAFMCISFLWILRDKIMSFFNKVHLSDAVTFIGSHTMWIYLWHIPFVYALENRFNAPLRFGIVYIASIIMTCIQTYIIKSICKRIRNESVIKKIQTIFIG